MARKVTAKTKERRRKEREVFRLKMAGATYADIAREVGYADSSGARYACLRFLKRLGKDHSLEVEKKFVLIALDRLRMAVWQRATAGQSRAVRDVLAILTQKALLLGLYPDKRLLAEVEVTDRRSQLEGLSIEAIGEIADAAQAIERLHPEDIELLHRLGWDTPQLGPLDDDRGPSGDGDEPAAD